MTSSNVEKLAVSPGVDVDSLAAVLEGVLEEHGEKDTEKCWPKDAPLFHPAADCEGFGCCPIETDRAVHVFIVHDVMMASRCRGHPILRSSSNSPLWLTRSNALVRSMNAT